MSAPTRPCALVTGAAGERGIGRAIVARLEAAGMAVETLDVRRGCTYEVDIVAGELPALDHIDVCVCNAGLATTFGAAHTMPLERWQRDLDVNMTGTLRVLQACLPGMRERRLGRVVVISSTAGTEGMPAQVGYSAAKAGLLGMVKTVAAENVALGITANAVLPGLTASGAVMAMPPEIVAAWKRTLPKGEPVGTEDIAEAVAYFASPAAGMVTGQVLTVDGGDSLNMRTVTSSVVGAVERGTLRGSE